MGSHSDEFLVIVQRRCRKGGNERPVETEIRRANRHALELGLAYRMDAAPAGVSEEFWRLIQPLYPHFHKIAGILVNIDANSLVEKVLYIIPFPPSYSRGRSDAQKI